MKTRKNSRDAPYRKGSYRESSKSAYYTAKQEQKPSYNFIQESKLRIVQDNLVSVTGLSSHYDNPSLLSGRDYFGKYGTVNKVIISSQGKNRNASIQVYVTYERPLEAAFAIKALDGIVIEDKEIAATFGTTKYCTYFLKQNECRNDKCFYLHEYDTKNELVDGVKNNLDFLDEKAENLINRNLRAIVAMLHESSQFKAKENLDFPTVDETVQYLIDEGIIKENKLNEARKEFKQQHYRVKKQSHSDSIKEDTTPPLTKSRTEVEKSVNNSTSAKKTTHSQEKTSKTPIKKETAKQPQHKKQQAVKVDTLKVEYEEKEKNKKCNSLSTAPSPSKGQKQLEDEDNIDRAIEKRIIKEIMKSKIVFKSKMDFASTLTTVNCAKEENNKMKNYVKRYLLNEA